MKNHTVRVYPSAQTPAKEDQLAWKLAQVASDSANVDDAAAEMVVNRVIDNAAVALAAIDRTPVRAARAQALAHPREGGATLMGVPSDQRFEAEWAAWANGVAVRELDMHDTYLAADYSHPADNIPPILAVAQQCFRTGGSRSGADLVRAILVAYEVQIALVKGICLHEHKKDHIAHLCPAQAAGIGTLLGLSTETIYQAIQQAVHVSFSTRQSRKGEISSWKAYAPAHAGKLAIEAVDRAMRGERSPSPIYEGEDSVIAYMLDGAKGLNGASDEYTVSLPEAGEPCLAILESYTKAHSAEYQAQAIIDLAFRLREKIADTEGGTEAIEKVTLHTSHHTHYVIGTGSGDPQKFDPQASRETLDHSIMYIFAVALEDGTWSHVDSYAPERAARAETVRLWQKIETVEEAAWTERYHHTDPSKKAFGGRVEILLKNGERIVDELALANAHPAGAKPFARPDYIEKFRTLTEGVIAPEEAARYLDLCERLAQLSSEEIGTLNAQVPEGSIGSLVRDTEGIF